MNRVRKTFLCPVAKIKQKDRKSKNVQFYFLTHMQYVYDFKLI